MVVVMILLAGVIAYTWWKKSPDDKGLRKEVEDKTKEMTPQVRVASINISNIEKDQLTMKAKIVIDNPLPFGIKTNGLKYSVYIDSVEVVKQQYEHPIEIHSKDSSVIELPMKTLVRPMTHILEKFDKQKLDSATYTMKAAFKVDVPVTGDREFNLHFSKRGPAIRIPDIVASKIDVDHLNFKSARLKMALQVVNPNVFPLKLKEGHYHVVIDDDLKMDGDLQKSVDIPAKGEGPINMLLDISTLKLPKLTWKTLFDKKDTHYRIDFNCKLDSKEKMFETSTLAFSVNGNLEDLKEIKDEAKKHR